jgi:hypothetical protein
MNQKPHELFHPASYELPRDHYDELCTIRDKLLLMAQLAGTTTANHEHDTILIIRPQFDRTAFRRSELSAQRCPGRCRPIRNVHGSRTGALIEGQKGAGGS